MNLIGYVRVSTDEQAASGLGLEAQKAAILAYAEARGDEVVWWEHDHLSGGDFDRPGLQRALELVEGGWPDPTPPWEERWPQPEGIIVAKLDRLCRSVVHFGEILERMDKAGKALIAPDLGVDTSTAAGRLVANVLMAVAQWEREVIGERTKAALAAKKARGEQVGRAPEVPEAIEDMILDMRESFSYRVIARQLNRDQIPTARGGRWSESTVRACAIRARTRAAAA